MRYVTAYLLALFVVLGSITALNVLIDLDGRYRAGFEAEREIAALLRAGKAVAGNRPLDIPALRRFQIRDRTDSEIFVMGSSRALEVQATMADGPLLNASIDSAGLPEYLALAAARIGTGSQPFVLIGADPWIFLRQDVLPANLLPFRADLAREPVAGIVRDLNLSWMSAREIWRSSVSVARALESAQVLLKPIQDRQCGSLHPWEGKESPCSLWRPDGSYQYPAAILGRTADMVRDEVRLSTSQRGRLHAFTGHSDLDGHFVAGFESLLVWIKSQSAGLAIFLPPFHPELERGYSSRHDWAMVRRAELEIRRVAQAHNVPLSGSFSAAAAGCAEEEFFDSIHPKATCIARLVGPLLRDRPRAPGLSLDRPRGSS